MNNKPNIKAIIFDRDGVIINTEGLVASSVTQAFKHFGYTVTKEDLNYIIGRSADKYKDYFLSKHNFDFEEYRKLQKEMFTKDINNIPVFHKTIELIKELYSRNIPIALTTSAGKETTKEILTHIGIYNMFNVIVTKEDCVNHKPDPEPYLLTAKKLNIEPKDCLVLEDSELGVQSAISAGMYCFAIPNEYTQHQNFNIATKILNSGEEVLPNIIIK